MLGGGWLLLGRLELGAFAAGRMSASLGREVRIASLHVTPGRWVQVTASDLSLANLPGTTEPVMARLGEARIEVQAWSLLFGPPVVRDLSLTGLRVMMERDAQGQANWHFGKTSAPKNQRAGFPTLLSTHLADGEVKLRTSKGKLLDIRLETMSIQTPDAVSTASLSAKGAYNGVLLDLAFVMGSFDALRDVTRPFPIDARISSGEMRFRFQGGMTDPLNADGAEGSLDLNTPSAAPLLAIAGIESKFEPPLRLTGNLVHQGLLWELTKGSGALGTAPVTAAHLRLMEGQHGEPDKMDIELDFEALDLNELLGTHRPGDPGDADLPLSIDPEPQTMLSVKLTARHFAYAGLQAQEARLEASQLPGRVEVRDFSLAYQGGQIHAEGVAEASQTSGAGRVIGSVAATGLDVDVLRRSLGIGRLPLHGRIDGQFAIEGEGPTLNAATRNAHASAVVMMAGGTIARSVIESASTDIRGLFRSADGTTAISCLVGVLDMRGGSGTVSPLRIRTANGTVAGNGRFDLNRRQMDILVSSESETTSSYALDVPVRLTGSFDDPSISPAQWSSNGRALLAAGDDVSRLLPALQPFARRSTCLSRSVRRAPG